MTNTLKKQRLKIKHKWGIWVQRLLLNTQLTQPSHNHPAQTLAEPITDAKVGKLEQQIICAYVYQKITLHTLNI